MSIVLMPQSRLKVYLQTTKYLFAASVVSCLCLDCTGSGLQIQFVTLRSWSRQPSSQSSDQDQDRLGNPSDRVSCAGPLFSTIKVSLDVKIPASEHGRCWLMNAAPRCGWRWWRQESTDLVQTATVITATCCTLQCTLVTRDTGDTEHVNTLTPYHTNHASCMLCCHWILTQFIFQATRNDYILCQIFY